MSYTKVEVPGLKFKTKVAIRPYFENEKDNMGLEKYQLVVHDGIHHTEQLACLENNGIKRYLTGLNEFAPEVKNIQDEDKRNAKIKEIRTVVSELEKQLAANVIKPDDEEFWAKVKLLKPDNDDFWNKITIKAGNEPIYMDPVNDPYDLIKIYAIEAGGFSLIAKSLSHARTLAVAPKFYLDRQDETLNTKNEYRKIRNRALAVLQDLYDEDTNKLFYVAKVLDVGGATYTKRTSADALYESMDNYINGIGAEKDKKRAAKIFSGTVDSDLKELKLRAIVKDAIYYREIAHKADGYLYHTNTGTLLGKNLAEVVEYLSNPLNEDILGRVQDFIEEKWSK